MRSEGLGPCLSLKGLRGLACTSVGWCVAEDIYAKSLRNAKDPKEQSLSPDLAPCGIDSPQP